MKDWVSTTAPTQWQDHLSGWPGPRLDATWPSHLSSFNAAQYAAGLDRVRDPLGAKGPAEELALPVLQIGTALPTLASPNRIGDECSLAPALLSPPHSCRKSVSKRPGSQSYSQG